MLIRSVHPCDPWDGGLGPIGWVVGLVMLIVGMPIGLGRCTDYQDLNNLLCDRKLMPKFKKTSSLLCNLASRHSPTAKGTPLFIGEVLLKHILSFLSHQAFSRSSIMDTSKHHPFLRLLSPWGGFKHEQCLSSTSIHHICLSAWTFVATWRWPLSSRA